MAGFFVSISDEAERRGGSATAFGILQVRENIVIDCEKGDIGKG